MIFLDTAPLDYTAVGQTTHLATRMEQMARPGSVLMTSQTSQIAAEPVSSQTGVKEGLSQIIREGRVRPAALV